jgi:hypothetical protein
MKYIKKFEGLYYSDKVRKTIDDILVELKDNGFTYFFNDIREGFCIKIENTIYSEVNKEIFLMLEDYMRSEWGDVDISYQCGILRRGTVYKYGNTSSTKIKTITDIPFLYFLRRKEKLAYITFYCSRN